MVKINLNYEGSLRVKAEHAPSQKTLITDAPVDNHGKGESFSPTDLLATSLGTCMATIMGIVAERNQIDLKGMEISVEKTMSQDSPRRVAKLDVRFEIPAHVDPENKKLLENAARTCPVAQSISPKIELNVDFHWK